MSKCCAETSFFETEGQRQVRTCSDLCYDLDFLLKLFALIVVCLSLVLPIYFQMTIFTNGMAPLTRTYVGDVFYTAALGALIALIVLIVLVIMDEERHFMEIFFLLVYAVFLIAAGVYVILLLTRIPNVETRRANDRRPRYKNEESGKHVPQPTKKTTTIATTTTDPLNENDKKKRAADSYEDPNTEKELKNEINVFMNKVFRSTVNDTDEGMEKSNHSSKKYVFPILLIMAGVIMVFDFLIECFWRT